jgi:FkbM family methyltransferase
MGVRCLVNNVEDFQIISEIFLFSNYNFAMPGDLCVIDVGMNVGLASLYFARRPEVRVVYAFEPFSRPFARALENFALNPEFSSKIKPNNVGLAGTTEALEVSYLENSTIGCSIRGRGEDGKTVDKISIREASQALRPLIQDAARNKQSVVLKMDCEGSEFPIIESLQQANLLKDIDVFMIEWHQFWSADKSNKNIVEPLVASGFFVLDFSRAGSPGGMIYAGRGRGNSTADGILRSWREQAPAA